MESDSNPPLYVLDSSGWISIDDRSDHNRILFFVGKLIDNGQIKSPPEVWSELKRCHNVLAWISTRRKDIVQPLVDPDYYALIGEVTYRFPQMAGARGNKEKADQYVVAMAAYLNRKTNRKHYVVAAETAADRPNRKIPTACNAFSTECISIIEMLQREFPDDF